MSHQPGSFDMSKLSTGEKLVLGGAGAYFIWCFIPGWYSFSSPVISLNLNGFRFPMILAWLLAIAAIAEIVLRQMANMKMNLPWPVGTLHLMIGGAALVLTLLGLLIKPTGWGISWALFVGIIIAAVWAYGAYMMYSQPAMSSPAPPTMPGSDGGFTS